MNVQIYTFICCPCSESPSQENCTTINVVASSIEDAFACASKFKDDVRIVSFSYTADAVLSGTIVDFE